MRIPRLESLSHVAFIVACLTLSVYVGKRVLEGPASTTRDARQTTSGTVRPGDELPLPGAGFEAFDRTAVLWISTTCRYCTESVPFYRQLAAKRHDRENRVGLIVASYEPADSLERYLAQHDIVVDAVFTVPTGVRTVEGTPTITIVDARGTVVAVRAGLLTAEGEREVLSVLGL